MTKRVLERPLPDSSTAVVFGSSSALLWCGAAYLTSALTTLAIARLFSGPVFSLRAAAASGVVWGGLLVPLGLGLYLRRYRSDSGYWQVIWGLLCVAVLLNLATRQVTLRSYGDSAYLEALIEKGETYPRWLAGTAALSWIYAALWRFPPLLERLPATLAATSGYVGVAGALSMALGTIALIRRWPGRLAVLLPTLTPVWLLFSSGYREYYPFVACGFVAALAWLFDGRLEQKDSRELGLTAAGLPLLYIGFAPLSVLVLAAYAITGPARAARALGWACLGGVAIILICWPAGVADFFKALYGQMNFGELNTEFARYQGQSAGPASIFFTTRYAISAEHLSDVAYMFFWGGGIAAIGLLLLGTALTLTRSRPRLQELRLWLAVAILGWQFYYLLFMIPKLGPTRDIDLFFTTFITIAFFAGLVFDSILADRPGWPLARAIAASALLGNAMAAALFLLGSGVPVRV